MAKIDKITVDNTQYDIVSGDNLPVGTEVEVEDGTTIPTGWEEVEDKGEIYSTTEQRIGTWIDGKPLYQITIQDTMPTITTDGTRVMKTIDISNLRIAKGISLEGMIDNSDSFGYSVLNSYASLL